MPKVAELHRSCLLRSKNKKTSTRHKLVVKKVLQSQSLKLQSQDAHYYNVVAQPSKRHHLVGLAKAKVPLTSQRLL